MEVNPMEQVKFNDITREFLEEFIPKLSKEDKQKMRAYIEAHPRDSSSSMFAMVKSYVYNTYFRAKPQADSKNRGSTFADTIDLLLMEDEEDEE